MRQHNEDYTVGISKAGPYVLKLIVREDDVASIADCAARRAEIKRKLDAGMTMTKARRVSADVVGTDKMKSTGCAMLTLGATGEQALLAVNK